MSTTTTTVSKRSASGRMYASAVCALLGSVNFGCVIGWISVSVDSLSADITNANNRSMLAPENLRENNSTITGEPIPETTSRAHMVGWLADSALLASIAGSFVASLIIARLGTRKTLILVAAPLTAGWTCIGLGPSLGWLVAGRTLTGLGAGIVGVATPTYLVELAATGRGRRFLGACVQTSFCVGQLALACASLCELDWRHLTAVAAVPALLSAAGMWAVGAETPTGNTISSLDPSSLRTTLARIRSPNSDLTTELTELHQRLLVKQRTPLLTLLRRPQFYRPAAIAVTLMVFQQLSGVNLFLFYLKSILVELGVTSPAVFNRPGVTIIILNSAKVAVTVHAASILNRIGAKMMLLTSGIGQTVALATLGAYYRWLAPDHAWIPLACLAVFVLAYSVGFGPVPWLMAGELCWAGDPRSVWLVGSLVGAVDWTAAFLVIAAGPALTGASGLGRTGTYWLFAGFNVVAVGYVLFWVPETRGRSGVEIEAYFGGGDSGISGGGVISGSKHRPRNTRIPVDTENRTESTTAGSSARVGVHQNS